MRFNKILLRKFEKTFRDRDKNLSYKIKIRKSDYKMFHNNDIRISYRKNRIILKNNKRFI